MDILQLIYALIFVILGILIFCSLPVIGMSLLMGAAMSNDSGKHSILQIIFFLVSLAILVGLVFGGKYLLLHGYEIGVNAIYSTKV